MASSVDVQVDPRPFFPVEPPVPASVETAEPLQALVLIHCSSCHMANEVAIPAFTHERTFTIMCHNCKAHVELTIDTAGEPIVCAEGLMQWTLPPPEPPPVAAVQPKKRKKGIAASTEEEATDETVDVPADALDDVEDDEDDEDDEEDLPLSNRLTGASGAKKPVSSKKTLASAAHGKKAKAEPAAVADAKSAAMRAAGTASTSNSTARVEGSKKAPSAIRKLDEPYVRPAVVKLGSVVVAAHNDGYFYTGTVQEIREPSAVAPPPKPLPAKGKGKKAAAKAAEAAARAALPQFLIAWDDGDTPILVAADSVVLAYRQPMPHELMIGMRVCALYSDVVTTVKKDAATGPDGAQHAPQPEAESDQGEEEDEEQDETWYHATVLRRVEPEEGLRASSGMAPADFELSWDGWDDFEPFLASCMELRTFLSDVRELKLRTGPPKPKAKRKAFRAERYVDDDAAIAAAIAAEEKMMRDERVAADLLRRTGRDKHKSDPSDMRLLRDAVNEFRRVWHGTEPEGPWELEQDARGVAGLLVCDNFLNAAEVEALRTVYGAHRAWAHYSYGTTGSDRLDSVVQRIDFGPRQMRAEGVVSGAPMWRLGSIRSEMLHLIEERLRHVCAEAGLWHTTRPDTLQLTKIGSAQKLANHWDRRDRWQEGIASIAWSELPCEEDVRGETWTLVMEKGSKKELQSVQVQMSAGSAYVLVGKAQGCTRVCDKRCVGHNRCNCCWTHGVQVDKLSTATRQSMTLRVLADSDDESSDDEEAGRPQEGAHTASSGGEDRRETMADGGGVDETKPSSGSAVATSDGDGVEGDAVAEVEDGETLVLEAAVAVQ